MSTADDYARAFEAERACAYPMVDALEASTGYAIDRDRLEAAARVLACPIKKSPPNWQHGRVLYALTRKYLASTTGRSRHLLDIGTAKGFSALCLRWALDDHGTTSGRVTSVDVIDPTARVSRKTVAEVDGLLTLAETLAPWPEAKRIAFVQSTGIDWLRADDKRIHVAFVDGQHTGSVVAEEGRLLSARQRPGDLAIFDDLQRADIASAVESLADVYRFEQLAVLPTRRYAIGVRL